MISYHRTVAAMLSLVGISLGMLGAGLAKGPEMEPEELVARHLEGFGDAETREGIQSRSARGVGQFEVVVEILEL